MRRFSVFWICTFLSASFLLLYAEEGQVTSDTNQQDLQSKYQKALTSALSRLDQSQKNHHLQLRTANDSAQKTIEAVNLLTKTQDYNSAEILLSDAIRLYPENILAKLVLADVFEKEGRLEESKNRYLDFLKNGSFSADLRQKAGLALLSQGRGRFRSGTTSLFQTDIANWDERIAFHQYVRAKLIASGVSVPAEKFPLIVRLKLEKDSFWLNVISTGLPLANLFFLLFLVFRYVTTDGEIAGSFGYQFALHIYFVFLFAYILWLVHLFVQTPPFFGSEETEISFIVVNGVILMSVYQITKQLVKIRAEREKALSDPTVMPCPFCRKIIQKLAAVCPHCKVDIP